EPAAACLVERPEDHRHEAWRAQTVDIVRKAVEPLSIMLVLRPARKDRGHGPRRIPRVAARDGIAHVPAQRDDPSASEPLGDPAAPAHAARAAHPHCRRAAARRAERRRYEAKRAWNVAPYGVGVPS